MIRIYHLSPNLVVYGGGGHNGKLCHRLLSDRFSLSELTEFAMDGEKIASGARHAENVENAIRSVYKNTEIEFNTYVSKINSEGVKVL